MRKGSVCLAEAWNTALQGSGVQAKQQSMSPSNVMSCTHGHMSNATAVCHHFCFSSSFLLLHGMA